MCVYLRYIRLSEHAYLLLWQDTKSLSICVYLYVSICMYLSIGVLSTCICLTFCLYASILHQSLSVYLSVHICVCLYVSIYMYLTAHTHTLDIHAIVLHLWVSMSLDLWVSMSLSVSVYVSMVHTTHAHASTPVSRGGEGLSIIRAQCAFVMPASRQRIRSCARARPTLAMCGHSVHYSQSGGGASTQSTNSWALLAEAWGVEWPSLTPVTNWDNVQVRPTSPSTPRRPTTSTAPSLWSAKVPFCLFSWWRDSVSLVGGET